MRRTRILQHALERAYKVMRYIEGKGYAIYRRHGLCSISKARVMQYIE